MNLSWLPFNLAVFSLWGFLPGFLISEVLTKNKLKKYAEVAQLPNVIQPLLNELASDYKLKGRWAKDYFKNNQPIVLELGCGKGEYALHLAQKYREQNFIGLDIKGARLWAGGQVALEKQLSNVAFIRADISRINSLFGKEEVSEIWITFPDPQPKKKQIKKRLTNPSFLDKYKVFLKDGGIIHLKTDNADFFEYTLEVIKEVGFPLLKSTRNLYAKPVSEILGVRTYYEKKFLDQGIPICYLQFQLPAGEGSKS